MVGERETAYGMAPRRSEQSAPPRSTIHRVLLNNVGQVGMVLATRLLEAGYIVVGREIAEECLRQFQIAGGTIANGDDQHGDVAWRIECHERPGVRPEVLTRLSGQHRGYGRPRLELSGMGRANESRGAVGALTVCSGAEHASSTGLQVVLDVSPRGLQFIVRGERTLFEATLSLLTVLADRVLYAGSLTADMGEGDARTCELSLRNHA